MYRPGFEAVQQGGSGEAEMYRPGREDDEEDELGDVVFEYP